MRKFENIPHFSKWALALALCVIGVVGCFQSYFDPYYFQIVIYIGINLILALSLNLICGISGQFSLGHAGFMALGAYMSAVLSTLLHAGPASFGLILVISGLVSAAAGFVVGMPSLRLRGDYLAITTLGFGEVIRVVIQNMEVVGGARGFIGISKLTNFFWVYAAVAVCLFIIYQATHSTYGKGFSAVKDDEIAAQAMGIDTTRYKVIAFVTGAFFAGVAGALFAHFITYITPTTFGFMKSIEIAVMVILGGLGNTIGIMVAVVLLTILPEALRGFTEFRMVIYSIVLIVVMLFCPQGLFPKALFSKWLNRVWTRLNKKEFR